MKKTENVNQARKTKSNAVGSYVDANPTRGEKTMRRSPKESDGRKKSGTQKKKAKGLCTRGKRINPGADSPVSKKKRTAGSKKGLKRPW